MGKSSSKTKESQKSSGETGPWKYATPGVQKFTDSLVSMGSPEVTPDQNKAFDQLKFNAAQGNPFTQQMFSLAGDSFNTADRTGGVQQALTGLQGTLGDYASGKYLDPMSNPQMAAMLQQVSDDAQNRVNAQFAAAGRDFSGMNQQSVAKGITQAQLPVLFDQFNKQQGMQVDAARNLYDAGVGSQTTMADLDQVRQQIRNAGIDQTKAALEGQNYGANTILDLEQQKNELPLNNMALYANLLFPTAQLGSTQQETASGTSKTTGWKFDLGSLLGRAPTGGK